MRKTLDRGPRGRRHFQEVEVQLRENPRCWEWIHLQHEGRGRIERSDCHMTVHEKFVEDMRTAGIVTAPYSSRFFWEGPAARSDQHSGPTLQDIIAKTVVPLQWDSLGSNYIVYPVGQADARWKDAGADSENDDVERDGYNDAYAAKTRKGRDEEDED